MTAPSFFWHDYETFGIDPRRDRPVQFAGVRTDENFNVIDDPIVVFCKTPDDYLPHPEACLLTGITPQIANSKGLPEAEFCKLLHEQFSHPNTCSLGYNSIRFDDEFTRNCLFRNFYDPYAREWQNGNSRWDLIDVVRATKALRPNGIDWPLDNDGLPSFKLEELTKANGLRHEAAHDALSDVYATIAMAKLLREKQPKIFHFLLRHRSKSESYNLLQYGSYQPVIHVSGRYSRLKSCLAVVLPICRHPVNANGILVYDLSVDPQPLLALTIDEIRERIFIPTSELSPDMERIPLKTVHLNKCPVLAPVSTLRPEDQIRLSIDLAKCLGNIEKIRETKGLEEKLAEVFSKQGFVENGTEIDPELSIYSGGFISDQDKKVMIKIRNMLPEELAAYLPNFKDPRFKELLFRYRARNYPATLTNDETVLWKRFCNNRLSGYQNDGGLTLTEFLDQLTNLSNKGNINEQIISQLETFALEKQRIFDQP